MAGPPCAVAGLAGEGCAEARRHAVCGLCNGLVGEVDVSLRRLDQRVTEQLRDGHHVHAVHGGDRRPGVAQVVKPQARQFRLLADAGPLVLTAI